MKQWNEEALQQWPESGKQKDAPTPPGADGKDLAVYEWLFSELSRAPGAGLFYGFAEKVSRNVQKRRYQTGDRRLYTGTALLCALGLALATAALALNRAIASVLWAQISHYKWMLLFAATCFFLIQWFDDRAKQQGISRTRSQ